MEDLDPRGRIEEGRGLVEDEEGAVLGDGSRYEGLLALPVGELRETAADEPPQTDGADGTLHRGEVALAQAIAGAGVGIAPEGDDVEDGEIARVEAVGEDAGRPPR